MQGILELAPTQIQMRACINLEHFVEVRLEPQMKQENVMSPSGVGGRTKPKKIGTQMVPTGAINVLVSNVVQGYSMTFASSQNAGQMYDEIRACIHDGGGIAQDLTADDKYRIEAARAAKQAAAEAKAAETEGLQDVDPDAPPPAPVEPVSVSATATAEVEADGFEPDGEFVTNLYTCSNCECEYSFECADPNFQIACPDCETMNSPTVEELTAAEDLLG